MKKDITQRPRCRLSGVVFLNVRWEDRGSGALVRMSLYDQRMSSTESEVGTSGRRDPRVCGRVTE